MQINLEQEEGPKAQIGALIEFPDHTIGLIAIRGVFLLKHSKTGNDWLKMTNKDGTFEDHYKKGNYTILARADEWEIRRITRDGKN